MTTLRAAAPAQPLTLTVEQTAAVLGVARSTAYELVRAGDVESIRLRRRIVVPVAHLAEWLGVTTAEVWAVVRSDPSRAERPSRPRESVRHRESPNVEPSRQERVERTAEGAEPTLF